MTTLLRILVLFFVLSGASSAQTEVRFQPLLAGEPLVLASGAKDNLGAAAGARNVEVLRWYLSDIELLRNGKPVFTPKKRHHLLDLEKPESLDFQLTNNPDLKYDEIRFTLGVDSLTAASGVFGEDLDPTNGMYWTWRSGYINFKLEGTAPGCPARKNRFQFHIGGFQGPFASQREVRLKTSPSESLLVSLDLDRFFDLINLKETYQVMSPNDKSAALADSLAGIFRIE